MNANEQDLFTAYQKYYRCQVALVVIAVLSQSGYNVAHWVFALKYWTLACKIERIKRGEDSEKQSKKYMIFLTIGVILNVTSAIICKFALLSKRLGGESLRGTSWGLIFTLPLFVSWLLLSDAFRRFKNTKRSEQTINN